MIRNKLAEIMFERDIKVVRMAKDIGISRNTITNTASNNSEMLQMNTINKMCKYLKITPCEFFEYIPVDLEFSFFDDEKIDILANDEFNLDLTANLNADLLIDITFQNETLRLDTKIEVSPDTSISSLPGSLNKIKFRIVFENDDEEKINDVFKDIPKSFRKMINYNLASQYKSFLLSHFDKPKNPNPFADMPKWNLIDNAEIEFENSFLQYY